MKQAAIRNYRKKNRNMLKDLESLPEGLGFTEPQNLIKPEGN